MYRIGIVNVHLEFVVTIETVWNAGSVSHAVLRRNISEVSMVLRISPVKKWLSASGRSANRRLGGIISCATFVPTWDIHETEVATTSKAGYFVVAIRTGTDGVTPDSESMENMGWRAELEISHKLTSDL